MSKLALRAKSSGVYMLCVLAVFRQFVVLMVSTVVPRTTGVTQRRLLAFMNQMLYPGQQNALPVHLTTQAQ